jgi:hypothetical protein
LNLAAGTAVTSDRQVESLLADRKIVTFLRAAAARTALTTARDNLTQGILARLGFGVPLLPCASLFAAKGAGLKAESPEYVAVNVMAGAGHPHRGDSDRGASASWQETIRHLVAGIEKRHEAVFIAHSLEEDRLAASWFPGRRRVWSSDPKVLLGAYSKASFAVCNRVHGAAAMASFGRPALVIGSDSRIDLIRQFGLPAIHYRDVNKLTVRRCLEEIESNYADSVNVLDEKSRLAEPEYTTRIRSAMNS